LEAVCIFAEGFFDELFLDVDFVKSDFVAAVFDAGVFGAADFVAFCGATVVFFGFGAGFGGVFLTAAVVVFGLGVVFFGAVLGVVFAFDFDELKSPLLLPKSCPKIWLGARARQISNKPQR
jgi:hypothetical protein